MEWKQNYVPQQELEKKQNDYMKAAMDMAARAKVNPDISKTKGYESAPKKVFEEKPAPKKAFEEKPNKKFEKPVEHVVEKVVEKPVEKVVKKVVPVPVVIKKVVEKPVEVEKIVEVPVERVVKQTPEVHITNQSKKIEINTDLDVNININKAHKKAVPLPEVVEVAPFEEVNYEETEEEHIIENIIAEDLLVQELSTFKCACPEPKPGRRCCRTSRPPNFKRAMNEHNHTNCKHTGGFSWKDFRRN